MHSGHSFVGHREQGTAAFTERRLPGSITALRHVCSATSSSIGGSVGLDEEQTLAGPAHSTLWAIHAAWGGDLRQGQCPAS